MYQKLSLRGTIQPEWKIFPLSAFEQIDAAQTVYDDGKIFVYRAVLTRW